MMDIAKTILENVPADPSQKALAQLAFESAHHEDALQPLLEGLNIPQETKADLWDAKKMSRNDPRLHKLSQITNLPKDVLDKAEAYPNTVKLLMAEEKEKEPKAAAAPKTAGGTKAAEAKPAKENANNPSEAPADMAGLPPMPAGTTHVKASDGSEHYIPHQNLGMAAKRDPGIKILRSA